ncbi:glycine cleavage system transcriptional repressor [Methylomagnum ishizawai]|uniref:Glycine cleavage system transcriptional repressor n=1 Tax=Methylomagnum ishizawai TaxID=1760988 RepID=A0A1Y6CUV9_9GAMM|nr:ACT domain-containing protein [Methylomagnum ishizawai]SMF94201.1 glycine cleavage system transcriptional repressor [Methylomagnum ishizawai]
MRTPTTMQLVVTVLGVNRPDLVVELTRAFKDCKCMILESRMTELGNEFAAHLLAEGNWNHIVRLENSLESLATRYGLKIATLRAQEREEPTEDTALPYAVDIYATDQINNIHDLSNFFTERGIDILDLSSSRYPAPFTGSPLFLAHIIVKIPAGTRIVSLRDEFLDFCDQMNLDAILEPVKR